jgi:hypothetical protein
MGAYSNVDSVLPMPLQYAAHMSKRGVVMTRLIVAGVDQ